MPEMYDKLGELLSESLETGEIKRKNNINIEKEEENDGIKDKINAENHYTNQKDTQNMHKYTENMQFSSRIINALHTLDIAYPFDKSDIKKQYRKLLKKYHPDTSSIRNTIQDTEIVDKLRQLQLEKLQEAYKILKDYFEIE